MNNASLGLTIQKLICDEYKITPNPHALRQFEASFNPSYAEAGNLAISKIFEELNLYPTQCLTYYQPQIENVEPPAHNFVLSNGQTLSIRTNLSGDKIAPRVVGQAGIETFNEHFSQIVGKRIKQKEEIKEIIYEKIHLMLPIFIDYFFTSDYTVWIQLEQNGSLSYKIFDKSGFVDIDFNRDNFSFTRNPDEWNESTTLKYKELSLAEIQVHTNRTFKFRFIMNSLVKLIDEHKDTTETFGITAEKVICDLFNLEVPKNYEGRYSVALSREITPTVKEAFTKLPKAIKSTGAEPGKRGKSSKCSYDFLLEGNKTLSLKTNSGKMVCPPEVGQPGAETCYLYFKDYIEDDRVTPESFKSMVFNHIEKLMPIYINHLFDSDYLLWIAKRDSEYIYKIFNADFAKGFDWNSDNFSFTRDLFDWDESNTVKYNGISIGEFQVHKKRSSYKFRFNIENLEKLINE